MAKHRAARTAHIWVPAVAVFAVAAVLLTVVLLRGGQDTGGQDTGGPTPAAAGPCTPLRVVTATSFAPVLEALAPQFAQGAGCLSLDVIRADGRAAAGVAAQREAHLWIPDDGAWASSAGALKLADDRGGAGTVVATSPIYMVTDRQTGERLRGAGSSWLALAKLVDTANGLRLAVREPAGSGEGLIGAGAVAEAVWIDRDMDASALWLARAQPRIRTVGGAQAALPSAENEVGLVPEHALLPALAAGRDLSVLPGNDFSVLLRYTFLPTAASVEDPQRVVALDRLRTALTGPQSADALAAARLRGPDGAAPAGTTGRSGVPELGAKPLKMLGSHHVDHVFATWYPQDRRTDLLVVVDVSGSMAHPVAATSATTLIEVVRRGSRAVVGLLPDDARMGLWEFGVELDGARDHRVLIPEQELTDDHRTALGAAVDKLAARRTGTGLYDTILAAYQSGHDNVRPDAPTQVLVFTDGRNEDDPGGLTAAKLRERLEAAKSDDRPVQLSVVVFGQPAEGKILEKALKPVDGYVDVLTSADEVSAVFLHTAAGGLHG